MKTLHLFAVAGAASLLLGCEPDYEIRVEYISNPPPEVQIDTHNIFIPKGVAVGVRIIPIEDDERIDEDVDLTPSRPSVLGVDGHNLDDDSDNAKVLYGREEGNTPVDVYFDDDLAFTLMAIVTQPIAE